MTEADVQARLDNIVTDLGKPENWGKTINIMFRNPDNTPNILPISSDGSGVVNAAQLAAVQAVVDSLKTALTAYNTSYTPVKDANEDYKTARSSFDALVAAQTDAQTALKTAQEADATFVAAKAALDAARTDPNYVAAANAYRGNNVSENIAELTQARGAFVP